MLFLTKNINLMLKYWKWESAFCAFFIINLLVAYFAEKTNSGLEFKYFCVVNLNTYTILYWGFLILATLVNALIQPMAHLYKIEQQINVFTALQIIKLLQVVISCISFIITTLFFCFYKIHSSSEVLNLYLSVIIKITIWVKLFSIKILPFIAFVHQIIHTQIESRLDSLVIIGFILSVLDFYHPTVFDWLRAKWDQQKEKFLIEIRLWLINFCEKRVNRNLSSTLVLNLFKQINNLSYKNIFFIWILFLIITLWLPIRINSNGIYINDNSFLADLNMTSLASKKQFTVLDTTACDLISPNADIDLTTSTDYEDGLAVVGDFSELGIQELAAWTDWAPFVGLAGLGLLISGAIASRRFK